MWEQWRGRAARLHWQWQPPSASAAAPQQMDFSLTSQHVVCLAGEQHDDAAPWVVGDPVRAASDRESVGCVVIVLPFGGSVCAGLRRRRAQEDATQDRASILTNVDTLASWMSRRIPAISVHDEEPHS